MELLAIDVGKIGAGKAPGPWKGSNATGASPISKNGYHEGAERYASARLCPAGWVRKTAAFMGTFDQATAAVLASN